MLKPFMLAISLLGFHGHGTAADKDLGRLFQFKDWEVACDNTRRCQAAGYQPEGGLEGVDWDPVAVLLTREAGPGTPVEMRLLIPQDEASGGQRQAGAYSLQMGDFTVSGIRSDKPLPAAAALTVLSLLPKAQDIRLQRGSEVRHLSLAGVNAALLKIDDVQGRVGTPSALLRQGGKPEATVLPALPAPLRKPVPFMPLAARDAALVRPVLDAVKDRACWDDMPQERGADRGEVFRVDAHKLLVTRPCWKAAYQEGSSAWLASGSAPHAPQALAFADVDGQDMVSPASLFLAPQGLARAGMKGRGIGDCWSRHAWAWDGGQFVLSEASASGMCRMIPGGVSLRLWTSRAS